MNGYFGRMLIADLSNRRAWTEALGEDLLRLYIGGSGLGAYLLARRVSPAADPLGPENELIFTVGPFCLTRVPTSGRHQLTTL
ncbi:MAG TPA: aldehyde ferredoxin oxidoreductase N-terminal domain-containing protein, partial [Magnetospirillaceae bacterium]|nr:aldehyde ferredoxin oxidoreductase N-terminal domain-containing protein [Magnetospirillaceae bacterium]